MGIKPLSLMVIIVSLLITQANVTYICFRIFRPSCLAEVAVFALPQNDKAKNEAVPFLPGPKFAEEEDLCKLCLPSSAEWQSWAKSVKANKNAHRTLESAHVSVTKLNALGYCPLLFVGRHGRKGVINGDMVHHIPVNDEVVREILKKMGMLYEHLLKKLHLRQGASTAVPGPMADSARSGAGPGPGPEDNFVLHLFPSVPPPSFTPSQPPPPPPFTPSQPPPPPPFTPSQPSFPPPFTPSQPPPAFTPSQPPPPPPFTPSQPSFPPPFTPSQPPPAFTPSQPPPPPPFTPSQPSFPPPFTPSQPPPAFTPSQPPPPPPFTPSQPSPPPPFTPSQAPPPPPFTPSQPPPPPPFTPSQPSPPPPFTPSQPPPPFTPSQPSPPPPFTPSQPPPPPSFTPSQPPSPSTLHPLSASSPSILHPFSAFSPSTLQPLSAFSPTECRKHRTQKVFLYDRILRKRVANGIAEVKVRWQSCTKCGKAWKDSWEPAEQYHQK
ncbi:unnamed protein product [Boreogadus saida]